MTSPELDQLLHVLEELDTGLGRDDIQSAFESAESISLVTAWVQDHLSSSTLLTCEEAEFAKRMSSSSNTISATDPLIPDEDLESAIRSLEVSTASIERQCRMLEAQKKALLQIQARNATSRDNELRAQRSSRSSREKVQVEFEVSELASDLQSRMERSVKQSEATTDDIHATVERTLEKDDRLLDGLQKILPQLSENVTGAADLVEVDDLCQALNAVSSMEIHARIDSAFRTALKTGEKQPNGTHSPSDSSQVDSLKAELEELCREIDGLSTMAVDAQYRHPISKALAAAKSDSDGDKTLWMQYTGDTLQHLTSRLAHLADGTQQLRSQKAAFKSISHTLDGVIATTMERQYPAQRNTQSPSKVLQKGLKPLRLVQANLSESHDPAAQLLRHLDVRIADSRDLEQLAESLEIALQDKHERLTVLSARTEAAVTDQTSRSLAQMDAQVEALLKGVYAYSPYNAVNLVREDITEGIKRLEGQTEGLSESMRELDIDRMGTVIRQKQKELLRQ